MDDILNLACEELKEKYKPHTIILYGSYARNEANESSDIDIACFYDGTSEYKDARVFHNTYLDAWVYPTSFLDSIPEESLRFGDGIVLYDERGLGSKYISQVKQKLAKGKSAISENELAHLQEWVKKMLARANDEDIDGNYRRIWLQHELLTIYFEVRGLWFLGPKKSFSYLKSHDNPVFELFSKAYKEPTNMVALEALAKKVVRI